MQLKNLKLPDSVISSLYRQTLVLADDNVSSSKQPQTDQITAATIDEPVIPGIPFLGENKSKILIVVDNKNDRYLPDNELLFLTSMLSACKLGIADVAIVNCQNSSGLSYKELKHDLQSNTVLLFGSTPESITMPMSFPHFQVQSFNNTTFLCTPSLAEIQQDKMLKSKLWVCLRRIFNV
jgi:hypothetical protein